MWRAFLLLGPFVAALPLAAQTPRTPAEPAVVSGIIKTKDGVPIPGALITSRTAKVQVRSSEKGEYSMILPPGRQTLKVQAKGFFDREVAINDLTAGAKFHLDLAITEITMEQGPMRIWPTDKAVKTPPR